MDGKGDTLEWDTTVQTAHGLMIICKRCFIYIYFFMKISLDNNCGVMIRMSQMPFIVSILDDGCWIGYSAKLFFENISWAKDYIYGLA